MTDKHRTEKGCVVWFTGLSGAGKSTLASALNKQLLDQGYRVELLDGDLIRQSLCKDLGFSREDREENIRRVSFVAGLLARHGVVVLVSAITPYRRMRQEVREKLDCYFEVFVDAPLATCEARDPKGLYQRARKGELLNFTGIDDSYETPLSSEVECRTDLCSIEQCVARVWEKLEPFLSNR